MRIQILNYIRHSTKSYRIDLLPNIGLCKSTNRGYKIYTLYISWLVFGIKLEYER